MKSIFNIGKSLLLFVIVLFVFSLAFPSVPEVNSKPPASTPTPTATAEPTPTPTPSDTPASTPTPTATPIPIPETLDSWAWSSNIGWVDMRSIKIDSKTGILSGFAWSPNVGWIKFHDLDNYPDIGSKATKARMNLDTGIISGWVRACAGTIGGETPKYGADCRTMDSRTDGWDGWIELSDDKLSKDRVRMDIKTGKLSGFAWGSSVIGWLQFGALNDVKDLFGTCSGSSDAKGVITFTANAGGGSGDYWYRWNDVGNFTKINKLIIPSSTKPSESATLQITDMKDGSHVEPICNTVERKGRTVNGSCTINGQVNQTFNLFVGDSATVALSQVYGGTGGPYTYKLFMGNGLENFINPTVRTFNSPISTDVYIRATDKLGIITSNIMCGKINVTNRELSLKIGPNGNVASLSEYRVKLGSVFGLKWVNTLPVYNDNYIDSSNNPDGYTCTRSITKSAGSNWSNLWEKDTTQSGSVDSLNTTETGKFLFTIDCRSNKFGSKQASALLNVILTIEKEI